MKKETKKEFNKLLFSRDLDEIDEEEFKKEFLKFYPDTEEVIQIGDQPGLRIVWLKSALNKKYFFYKDYYDFESFSL
jgi:hypothetical protein